MRHSFLAVALATALGTATPAAVAADHSAELAALKAQLAELTAKVAELEAHVRQEEKAHEQDGPESIRLSGEFHIKLAKMTGNALLLRYVQEASSRCSLN